MSLALRGAAALPSVIGWTDKVEAEPADRTVTPVRNIHVLSKGKTRAKVVYWWISGRTVIHFNQINETRLTGNQGRLTVKEVS